ncbi:MAG: phosphotriesterase family protein [Segniliparus sp.]|uniref:phosphotriesterase family protein n=1 Tax=Segniliparus sp. TaxID=2804064 RepID=UPI003F328807
MAMVSTIRGDVDVDELGCSLMHEHVFVLGEEVRLNYPETWDEETRVADAVAKLRALRERGVTTIADPTVIGLGRNVERVARVNAQVDIHIIPATGLYTYRDVPFPLEYSPWGLETSPEGRTTADPLVKMFVKDLTEGIAATGIRAAFLKAAIGEPGMAPGVERVLRAVAVAHKETGAPITVHTDALHQRGREVVSVFREYGVDFSKVVIGHSGDSDDMGYLLRLIDSGSLLGMDRFGLDPILSFEKRVDTVVELCRRGLADRMVLAHDAACHIDWYELSPGVMDRVPKWNFTHIHDDVLPALRDKGVSEADIRTMLVANPRRYFTPAGA